MEKTMALFGKAFSLDTVDIKEKKKEKKNVWHKKVKKLEYFDVNFFEKWCINSKKEKESLLPSKLHRAIGSLTRRKNRSERASLSRKGEKWLAYLKMMWCQILVFGDKKKNPNCVK